jgi:CubicO group peptidase (beta-lactamase class C family)
MHIALFLTVAVFAETPAKPPSANLDQSRLALIPQRLKAYVDRGEAPGFVTLVERAGNMAHLEAVGWQDREKKLSMKPDTIFQVMSMTKPVTAAGIQMLVEDGLLALNDPVERYLPEFRGQMMIASKEQDRVVLQKPSRRITIRDLLTHTSGMPEMPPEGMGGVRFYYDMNRTLADAVSIFSQMPLQFEPGTKWSYSNTGIAALGRIIEVVSDKPYETFLQDRIFQPLGMKDSFFFPAPEKYSRIAAVYQFENGKMQNMGDRIYRKGAKYSMPEGGLYATAQDMAAFYRMVLNGGRAGNKRLLSKASTEVMTAVHTEGTERNWGLGWSVARGSTSTLALSPEGAYGHGGAFGTYGWVNPKTGLVTVFMVQTMGGGGPVNAARMTFLELANAAVVD